MISIAGGKFVGVAQVAVRVVALVALVINFKVMATAKCRAIRAAAIHGFLWISVDCHLVWLVVTVLQRKQKCLGAAYKSTV